MVLSIVKHKKLLKDKIPIAVDVDRMYYYIEEVDGEQEAVKSVIGNQFTPVPYIDFKHNGRSAILISSMSGSGKSTLACKLIKEQLKLFKNEVIPPKEVLNPKTKKRVLVPQKRKIVLFTVAQSLDPAFEKAFGNNDNFIHIPTSDPNYMQLTIQNLAYCIVVFDDFENATDKVTNSFTLGFIKQLLEHSRKLKIHLILINHVTQNGYRTKDIIFESDTFCLFPFSNQNSVSKFLKAYGDVTKEESDQMIKNSMQAYTSLCFHKSYPRYYVTSKNIALL